MTLRAVEEPVVVGLKRRGLVFDALSLLVPFDLPRERKVRIGEPGDGSYVMVDRLRASQPVMSFGVGPSVEFEMEMAERGHSVFMFDHTIDSLPATHPRFAWFREGITGGPRPETRTVHSRRAHGQVAVRLTTDFEVGRGGRRVGRARRGTDRFVGAF